MKEMTFSKMLELVKMVTKELKLTEQQQERLFEILVEALYRR